MPKRRQAIIWTNADLISLMHIDGTRGRWVNPANDSVPSDNKPLPGPILSQIYVVKWCHYRSQWVKRERSGVTAHQNQDLINPDDIIKLKQFPCYRPFVWEIHRSPVNSPAQRPVTQSFDVFFDLHLSRQLSKQWRHWWFEMLPHSLWPHCNGENATWRVEWIKVSWIYIVKFYVQGK